MRLTDFLIILANITETIFRKKEKKNKIKNEHEFYGHFIGSPIIYISENMWSNLIRVSIKMRKHPYDYDMTQFNTYFFSVKASRNFETFRIMH